MTDTTSGKLKNLLDAWPARSVMTSRRLAELGISNGLAREYVKNGWMQRVGRGAFKRPNSAIDWTAGVASIQNQLQLPVHVGALSALALQGASQYLRLARETIFLFSGPDARLPTWFKNHEWEVDIDHVATSFLPYDLSLREESVNGHDLRISSPERALLECLYLAPDRADLMESYEVAQGLMTLRPDLIQKLLEACNSVKVKRLFLFVANKAALPVMEHLDQTRIDLGSGSRSIVAGGVYDGQSNLILPKELVQHD